MKQGPGVWEVGETYEIRQPQPLGWRGVARAVQRSQQWEEKWEQWLPIEATFPSQKKPCSVKQGAGQDKSKDPFTSVKSLATINNFS